MKLSGESDRSPAPQHMISRLRAMHALDVSVPTKVRIDLLNSEVC